MASATAGFVYGASRNQRPHDQAEGEDLSNDEDSSADGDLSAVTAGLLEPCKLVRSSSICCIITPLTGPCVIKVLVVRTDLDMTPGKIAAQCGCVPASQF